MTSLRVIDWFSGIGGFHLAFSRAGHRVAVPCIEWLAHRFATYA